jgi:hypothetical protein
MSEFRFPPLRTNLLKEVSFGLPSQDYDQIPLLPNLLTVPMVTLPNAVTTFSYAIKDDPGKGKVYSWTRPQMGLSLLACGTLQDLAR